MSKGAGLTKKDIEYYKGLLLGLRIHVLEEMGKMEGECLKKNQKDLSGDLSGYSFHMADMATDSFNTEFTLGLISNENDILKEIDDALKRIDDGTYGICEKYNVPISKNRLKAVPYARYSLKAQEEEEKRKT